MDAETLSRIQFAFTITFHILFPAFSIGLVSFLAIMEGCYLKTKNPLYLSICKFWSKIFALTFGMGVVSGVVMEFQFGTNWAGFANKVGGVLGALFVYEVMTAFFVEAGFLGVMLFGWNKVGPKLHYLATLLVTLGVTLSAFWILSANSWMQHPTGFNIVNGRFLVTSWWHVVFNPLVIPRFIHMLLSAYITTAMIISGICAYYLLIKQHLNFAKHGFSFAMWALLILLPIQIFIGDMVGRDIHQYQPLKTAAMEGIWKTSNGAPFLIFAIPDQAKQKNYYELGIPHAAALINTHQWNGKLVGLKSVSRADQPMVDMVFFSFRIMVGLGILMFLIALIALWLRYKNKLFASEWFLKGCVLASPAGFLAIETGWFTAEMGRQPWAVYGYLRTIDAASRVNPYDVLISLIMILIVYGIMFGIFYFLYLYKTLQKGPLDETKLEQPPYPFGYLSANIQKDEK